jgi:translation initiation factor 1 (eIF-1/SUI1)
MSKSLSIDRDTLYNEIWRIPMITLGQEKYGVSRSTIKWACMQMGVPLPPQAYWTHLARGRKIVDQPPLPPRRQNQPQTISRAELMKQEPKNPETFEQLLKRRQKALRIMEEEIRYAELMEEVDGWQRAESIRRYLSELDRRIAAGGTSTEGYAEWRAWAERCATDLDSSTSRVELDEG